MDDDTPPYPGWTMAKKPCKRGHMTWRYGGGSCVECGRERSLRRAKSDIGRADAKAFRQSEKGKAAKVRSRQSEAGKAYQTRRDLRRNYGLTIDAYNALFVKYDRKCAICGTDNPGGKGKFHVDHDHKTKLVRGILCAGCNLGIGHLSEDISKLERAIVYLSTSWG